MTEDISKKMPDLTVVDTNKSQAVGHVEDVPGEGGLSRSLSQRHLVSMICLKTIDFDSLFDHR